MSFKNDVTLNNIILYTSSSYIFTTLEILNKLYTSVYVGKVFSKGSSLLLTNERSNFNVFKHNWCVVLVFITEGSHGFCKKKTGNRKETYVVYWKHEGICLTLYRLLYWNKYNIVEKN